MKRAMNQALLVVGLLLISNGLKAQVAGRISGYVRDPSGAVIAGAAVSAVSEEQHLRRTTTSDNTGFYDLVAMPPGSWVISADRPGFEKQVQTGVMLTTAQLLRLDMTLKVGAVQSEVTVVSSASLVNTVNQTLSGLVDDRRVQDLPLNGRNIMSMAGILPGVTNITAPQELGNTRAGPAMAVNGGRQVDNNFTFNGANFTHFGQTTGMNYPPPDAVQEVQIQTHNFDSQYGNSAGSQVSVVSKKGTNGFHGAAWEFLRNDQLNARSFFQPKRLTTRQNQAGGSGGGPIKRDRLFFFGYYQKLWNRPQSGSTVALVPSDAQRNGDFTALRTALKNPNDALTGQPYTDSSGRPCVQGNMILPGCISPAAKNILDQFIPHTPNGSFVGVVPTPSSNYSYMGRIDYLQSIKHNIYGHFYVDSYQQTFANGNIQPFVTGARAVQNKDFSLTSTYTLKPTLINEVTFDYLHATSSDTPNKQYTPSSLGIPLPPGLNGEGISTSVSGYFNLNTADPNAQDYINWHLRESMTWIHGRHSLKWGYEMYKVDFTLNSKFTNGRSVTFSGAQTGDAMADFLLGNFDQLSVTFGQPGSNPVQWKHFFYIQDEFKAARRFTLTFGTRWEPYF